MKKVKVTHFLQDPGHCAVAACATAANSFSSNLDYNKTKDIAYKKISKKSKKSHRWGYCEG